MSDINTCTMMGRLVREPAVHTGASGGICAQFTLASNQRFKDKQGTPQTETAFIPCKGFGGWATALTGRRKGETVLVTGRFRTESWDQNGSPRTQLILVCSTIHVLSFAAKDSTPEPQSSVTEPPAGDTVPF